MHAHFINITIQKTNLKANEYSTCKEITNENDEITKRSSAQRVNFHAWFIVCWPFTHYKIKVDRFIDVGVVLQVSLTSSKFSSLESYNLGFNFLLYLEDYRWFIPYLVFVLEQAYVLLSFCLLWKSLSWTALLSFYSTRMPLFFKVPLLDFQLGWFFLLSMILFTASTSLLSTYCPCSNSSIIFWELL